MKKIEVQSYLVSLEANDGNYTHENVVRIETKLIAAAGQNDAFYVIVDVIGNIAFYRESNVDRIVVNPLNAVEIEVANEEEAENYPGNFFKY